MAEITIEKQNDLIRKFMGFIHHEVVDIDFSDCGGLYTKTDVYCKDFIPIEKYPYDDQSYLKEDWVVEVGSVIYGKLKYHESMDWLLPVITKIESFGYCNSIKYRQSGDSFFHDMVFYDKDINNLIVAETYAPGVDEEHHISIAWVDEAEKKTKLEVVYRAVVNFIKYYNHKNETRIPY